MIGRYEYKALYPRGVWALATLVLCCLPADGRAQQVSSAPKSKSFAEQLAVLRTEVDDLDASLRSRRGQCGAALRGLETRLAETKIAEDAERLKVKSLEGEIAELKSREIEKSDETDALSREVLNAVLRLEKAVRAGLPFKVKERLAALYQIRDDLNGGQTTSADAATRVWRFVEDEQKLASTVERAEVMLPIADDATPRLVQAVRVGTVAMYIYMAPDRWGSLLRDADGAFSYSDVKDANRLREIKRLFASVEKQIREGRYLLPLLGKKVTLQ